MTAKLRFPLPPDMHHVGRTHLKKLAEIYHDAINVGDDEEDDQGWVGLTPLCYAYKRKNTCLFIPCAALG
jgi:hypothetical protein